MNKKLLVVLIIAIAFVAFVVIGNVAYNLTDGANEIKTTNEVKETKETIAYNLTDGANEIKTTNEVKETKETNNVQINEKDDKKVAVVYFSATGTTKEVAELIKDETNADIFEIIPKQKYTSEDLNYGDKNTRATKEQNDENARPEIENSIDLSNYDVVFLGYPIWWGNAPKIILSFIDNTNLDGKTVIPFCTSGSSGISTSESTLKTYKNNIKWIEGKRFSSSTTRDEASNWVRSLDY